MFWLFVLLAAVVALGYLGLGDRNSFFASVFGIAASAVFVLFLEALRRPKISIVAERGLPPHHDGRRFLRVLVSNAPTVWFMKPFVDRQPALLTSAQIVFLNQDDRPRFRADHNMQGRWSRTPEPVSNPIAVPDPNNAGHILLAVFFDWSRVRDTVDIVPGAQEPLDIVMRAPGSDTATGWHNEIINNPNPTKKFELPRGRFRALVVVQSSGRRFRKAFEIVNDVELDQFRLEPLRQIPKLPAGHPLAGD